MAKKIFGKLAALTVVAGAAVAGISYFKKYQSFNKELDEDFHDFEDEDTPVADSTMNRNYVSLNADKDELLVAAGDMLNAAKDVAGAAKNVVKDAAAIVVDTTREVVSAANDTASSARNTAEDKAEDLADATEDLVEDIVEDVTEAAKEIADQASTIITEDDSETVNN
ncbi:MAG: hypothetical protein ACRDBO_17320 [Lachnospiraceae bacterium]